MNETSWMWLDELLILKENHSKNAISLKDLISNKFQDEVWFFFSDVD